MEFTNCSDLALYVKLPDQESEKRIDKEPFTFKFKAHIESLLTLVLVFQGHYNEPDFVLQMNVTPGVKELKLDYDVSKGVWGHFLTAVV